jgi:hypothetical protein
MNPSAIGTQTSGSRMFGSTLADVFRAPDYHCVLNGLRDKPEFAVPRLRSGPKPVEKAPAYPLRDTSRALALYERRLLGL